jgi:hypothetical protein
MGCGTEGDEEFMTMMEDFEKAEQRIADLQGLLHHRK